MKRLQNEISRISTDLTQNLKIRIISISVLYQYFFEIFHFHIESNQIESYRYQIDTKSNLIVFCINFSISPIPGVNNVVFYKFKSEYYHVKETQCGSFGKRMHFLAITPLFVFLQSSIDIIPCVIIEITQRENVG
jgi:hypothetical protein